MSFVLFLASNIRYVCVDITIESMISVPQALKSVEKHIQPSQHTIDVLLSNALGYVLAEDVLSPIQMPPFNQSAMDGYAVCSHSSPHYKLIGEVQAGSDYHPHLQPGEAIRIFTGAPVPDSATAVIMQEKVDRLSDVEIQIHDDPSPFKNIRPKGEQIQDGDVALEKGQTINAAIIAFLSGLGVTHIKAYKKPVVAIIATGNELVKPGMPLKRGEIYESNAIMLEMALKENGFNQVKVYQVKDDYQSTRDTIKQATEEAEFVLLTGGISVGDYDFVGKALEELQAIQHFYKVKQKPGKPLYFGSIKNTKIFALPGNPAAALTSFYIYVLNSLCTYAHQPLKVHPTQAQLKETYIKKGGRAQFLKAQVSPSGLAEVLTGQSSAMLRAFAQANAFVYIPEDKEKVEAQETITLYSIPYA